MLCFSVHMGIDQLVMFQEDAKIVKWLLKEVIFYNSIASPLKAVKLNIMCHFCAISSTK